MADFFANWTPGGNTNTPATGASSSSAPSGDFFSNWTPQDTAPATPTASSTEPSGLLGNKDDFMNIYSNTINGIKDIVKNPLNINADNNSATKVISNMFNPVAGLNNLSPIVDAFDKVKNDFNAPTNPNGTDLPTTLSTSMRNLSDLANLAFSPISAVFKAAEGVPVLGTVAKGINVPFSAIGDTAKPIAEHIVNLLPISNDSKDKIREPFADLLSLAGQIYVGGKLMGPEKIDEAKTALTEKYDPITAEHIVNEAQNIAESHKNGGPLPNPNELSQIAEDVKNKPVEPIIKNVADVQNELNDIGYTPKDISRMTSDLYAKKPEGDFTPEDIAAVKEDYTPKTKDSATVTKDLTKAGYTPDEVNNVLKELHKTNPEGDFLKSDVNTVTQKLKGQEIYKTKTSTITAPATPKAEPKTTVFDKNGFRPVEKDEILPNGYTTKINTETGEQLTNAPVKEKTFSNQKGEPNFTYKKTETETPKTSKFASEDLSKTTPEEKATIQEKLKDYTKIEQKPFEEESNKIQKYVDSFKNKDELYSEVKNGEYPKDLEPGGLFNKMIEIATKNKDFNDVADFIKQQASAEGSSRFGQGLVMSKLFLDPATREFTDNLERATKSKERSISKEEIKQKDAIIKLAKDLLDKVESESDKKTFDDFLEENKC